MMQDLRQKTKIVMIVVALAFVGLMVFEWGMDMSGQSAAMQTGEIGRVNGRPISNEEYSATYQQLYQQAQQQQGGSLSAEQIREIERAAFDQVVNEILLEQEIARRGIRVTNEEIRQAARWNPHPQLAQQEIFLTDGRFDIFKWQQFLGSPAASDELLMQLEQYYRSVLPREKLIRQVTAGAYLSDAELWRLWRDQNEAASVEYVNLDLNRLVPGEVEVTEAEIRRYYQANEAQFTRPTTARLTLAVIPKADASADTAAARVRADAVRQEVLAGADFAVVAARESADPGSAQMGGALGTITRGQTVPPFEEAVFSLPIGQVSQPVRTDFGYHIIQVEERTGDAARARHILITPQPNDAALDRLYARADSLDNLGQRVGLERAARATDAQVIENVVVTSNAPFVPEIGSVFDAVDWAASEAAADGATVSPVFENPNAFYMARREAVTPAGRMSLQEASGEIRRRLVLEKKRAAARQIGEQILAEVRGGRSLEEAATARGLSVQTQGPFTRVDPNPVFGQASAAVGAAFGTPVGQVSQVAEAQAGLFLVRPTSRTESDREEFEAQKEQIRAGATFQLQQQQAARFLQDLRESADIVDRRNQVLVRS
jgi:peptidyl-prolyl cis-trans isomerase D